MSVPGRKSFWQVGCFCLSTEEGEEYLWFYSVSRLFPGWVSFANSPQRCCLIFRVAEARNGWSTQEMIFVTLVKVGSCVSSHTNWCDLKSRDGIFLLEADISCHPGVMVLGLHRLESQEKSESDRLELMPGTENELRFRFPEIKVNSKQIHPSTRNKMSRMFPPVLSVKFLSHRERCRTSRWGSRNKRRNIFASWQHRPDPSFCTQQLN